jgi:aryl-alcohol dehydrogenase-like predicted oxidoreductase
MQYARLGDSGLVVSRLAFGTMTFGSDAGPMGAVWKVDATLAERMVSRALDLGVNYFDTADVYAGGQSEEMLGRALGARRRDVVLASKVGFRFGEALGDSGLSARHIAAAVEGSLRRLGTDYLDLYFVHHFDPWTPIEETLRALEDVRRRGLVRYSGYSNLQAWAAAKALGLQAIRGYAPLVAAQMYYSLLGRDIEADTIPFLADARLGLVVWSPLAGGFLSGRYSPALAGSAGGRLTTDEFIPTDKELGHRVVTALAEMAAVRAPASVAQLALAWVLARPVVSSVLVGASNLKQLEENLGSAALRLTGEELARLDALTMPASRYPNWFDERTADEAVPAALVPR